MDLFDRFFDLGTWASGSFLITGLARPRVSLLLSMMVFDFAMEMKILKTLLAKERKLF